MVVIKQGLCGGEPTLENHRITVENILSLLFDTGEGLKLIKSTYPTLLNKDIEDTKNYIYELLENQMSITPHL